MICDGLKMKLKLGPLPEIVWETLTWRTVFDPISSHKGLWSAPDLESLWIQPKSYTRQHLHGFRNWAWVLASFSLLLDRRIQIIATQRLPEMPSLLSLYISTFHYSIKPSLTLVSSSGESVRPAKRWCHWRTWMVIRERCPTSAVVLALATTGSDMKSPMHAFSLLHSVIQHLNYKCQSARSWRYDSNQGIWDLCFHKNDSLGGETDIKWIICMSGDVNPSRCSAGEELVALREFSRGFILARASWKDVTGLSEWLDRDEWLKCKGSDSGPSWGRGQGADGTRPRRLQRSLLLIPRAVGSLMELQIWIRYSKSPISTAGEKDTQTIN